MKNTRFVIINNTSKTATVYDKTVAVATYEFNGDNTITAEEVEEIRVAEYKDKA